MSIDKPRIALDYPDYDLCCQEALDVPVRDLVDAAIAAGWEPARIFPALQEVARNQALGFEANKATEREIEERRRSAPFQ